jgi:hypothetical protein
MRRPFLEILMRVWILIALIFALAGCGGSSTPGLVPVSGTVKLKGEFLSGAVVTFIPTADTRGAGGVGRTDAEGQYQLKYVRGGKGVMPGQYKVTISRRLIDGKPVPEDYNVPEMDSPARESLPRHYAEADSTKLTATVAEGAPVNFDLK